VDLDQTRRTVEHNCFVERLGQSGQQRRGDCGSRVPGLAGAETTLWRNTRYPLDLGVSSLDPGLHVKSLPAWALCRGWNWKTGSSPTFRCPATTTVVRFSSPLQIESKLMTQSCWRIRKLIVEYLNGQRRTPLRTMVHQHIGSPVLGHCLSDQFHRLPSHP